MFLSCTSKFINPGGRGILRTEEVTGKPEWREALAAKIYKVIATLVAEGILNAQQVQQAVAKGQTDTFLRTVEKVYDFFTS